MPSIVPRPHEPASLELKPSVAIISLVKWAMSFEAMLRTRAVDEGARFCCGFRIRTFLFWENFLQPVSAAAAAASAVLTGTTKEMTLLSSYR